MSTEVATIKKNNVTAFYMEGCPAKYRHESQEWLKWAIDHNYDAVDPAGWTAYLQSLKEPQTTGKMNGRIYSAASQAKRVAAICDRIRYYYNHSTLSEPQRKEIEAELSKLKRPKRTKCNPRFLEPEEIEKLIDNVEPDLALILRFLWRTGIRVSELCNLTIKSVVKENGHCQATFIGKQGIEHTIRFETDLFLDIRKYFRRAKTYLFETERRKPYHRSAISMRIHRASQRFLGRPASAHVIRHSVATYLYDKTKDLKRVSEFVGHSSTDITARFYVHTKFDYTEEAQLLTEAIHISGAM